MRQIGIICAAALVALQENITKLEGDHKKAKILAGNFQSPWVFGFKCYFFSWINDFCFLILIALTMPIYEFWFQRD